MDRESFLKQVPCQQCRQSGTLISLPFIALLLDPLCCTICKEITPRKKIRPCTPPSFLPYVNFYSCFGAPCVTPTHTLPQTACSVMKRKLEEKWWWAGRGYLGRPHEQACSAEGISLVPAELTAKTSSPSDPTAVPSADSVWDVLTCPRGHIN